jgi:uncharacterized OsmC-like protein
MLSYNVKAKSQKNGEASAEANNSLSDSYRIRFDGSAGRQDDLPSPAELLLTALAACMLKNVERFSEILEFDYTKAEVEVYGLRNDSPPYMSKITYQLKVASDMKESKLRLLHKNILKFGTITNTIAKAADLKGTIEFL